jgi:hypothetical protein
MAAMLSEMGPEPKATKPKKKGRSKTKTAP